MNYAATNSAPATLAIRAAASVGGTTDFTHLSGNKNSNSLFDLKSDKRYKMSTKHSHSFNPCRLALDNTLMITAEFLAACSLPKNNQFLRPITNVRNVRSETLLSMFVELVL
jgi:hypothetical protein